MLNKKGSSFSSDNYRSRNFKGDWTKHFINDYVTSTLNNGVIETQNEFSEYKKEHLPPHLYKFMPPTAYSLMSLQQQTVYLSSPRTFNDPFDSYLCINRETFLKIYILDKIKNIGAISKNGDLDSLSEKEYWDIFYSHCEGETKNYNKEPFWSTFWKITNKKSEEFMYLLGVKLMVEAQNECDLKMDYLRNTMFRISCFSNFEEENELMENTTMWSHYADNHRGFCIKYSLNDIFNHKYKNILSCGLYPVRYTARTQEITAYQLLKLEKESDSLDVKIQQKVLKSFLTKSRFWSYEKEWRLIVSENDTFLLYENNIPFLKISAIYLGCRIDQSIKKHLVTIASDNTIPIYQTRQSDNEYSLVSYSINRTSVLSDENHIKQKNAMAIKNEKEKWDRLRQIDNELIEILRPKE